MLLRFQPLLTLRIGFNWLIGISLLAGALVRLRMYFNQPSYWYDEAYLLLNVVSRSYLDLLGGADYDQVAPPLFVFSERLLYQLFGLNELAMRLPALVASLLSLIVISLASRQLLQPRYAWLPVACLAISRHALIHSTEVKHYSLDLLCSACLLLAFLNKSGPNPSRVGYWGLLALAALACWASFAAAFTLGGISAALLVQSWPAKSRSHWTYWTVFTTLMLVSGSTLWYYHARHLYTPSLSLFWINGKAAYPDVTSLVSCLSWPLRVVVGVGQYGTREMGWPLAVLAGVGILHGLYQRSPFAVALLGSLALALAASYLKKYPLSERTCFFLLPHLYLAAALGLQCIASRFARFSGLALLLGISLLAVDTIWWARYLVNPPGFIPFREAFAEVHSQRVSNDAIWVSHPEVYRVYYGVAAEVYGYQQPIPLDKMTTQPLRVWLVFLRGPFDPLTRQTQMSLEDKGYKLQQLPREQQSVQLQLWVLSQQPFK